MATALAKAAPLKPEIKLLQALKDFDAILTKDQSYGETSPPEPKDVMALTCEINHLNANRRSRRWGTRLTTFLNSVQGFTTIVDVVVGNIGQPVASTVWGAVKTAMQIAAGFESYFKSLSMLLMNIGLNSPRYEKYALLYPNSAGLLQELYNYYTTVINLCKESILFVRKPAISQAFNSIRKPFDSEFGKFKEELIRLGDVIKDEVSFASKRQQNQEHTEAARERKESSLFRLSGLSFRQETVRQLAEAKKWRQSKLKSRFLNSCSTYNHETALNQARRKGSSGLICQDENYQQWKCENKSSTLVCSGIMGAGKTVLCASVVEDLSTTMTTHSPIAYFLCTHDDAVSLDAREMFGSLARQLLIGLPADSFSSDYDIGDTILNMDQLTRLLLKFLPRSKQYVVLLDGLDECAFSEAELITKSLRSLLWSTSHIFKIFWSGRDDVVARISRILEPNFRLIINPLNNGPEISNFIEIALAEALHDGRLKLGDENIIIQIQNALEAGAQEMFLWVTFQIDSICREITDEGILDVLEDLPVDLPTTFKRILRQLDHSEVANSGLAKKVFEIVAASQRPFTLEELREAISIKPGDTSWNTKQLVNDVTKALGCCGSLLVIDEEFSTIHFAHSSIKQFLTSPPTESDIQPYHVYKTEARTRLGEILITYLSLDVFTQQLVNTKSVTQTPDIQDPSRLLEASIRPTKVPGKLAQSLLRNRRRPGYDVSRGLSKASSLPTRASNTINSLYALLPYAQANWLYHTALFDHHTVGDDTLQLCIRAIQGRSSTIRLPWKSEDIRDVSPLFLHYAVHYQHRMLVSHVIKNLIFHFGAYRSMDTKSDQLKRLEEFLKQLPDKNTDSYTEHDYRCYLALQAAMKAGREALAELLLQKIGVNLSRRESSSLLRQGVRLPSKAIIQLLIDNGADVNDVSKAGRVTSPVHAAVALGEDSEPITRFMLENDASVDLINRVQTTVLRDAVIADAPEPVLELLLHHGAHVNYTIGPDQDYSILADAIAHGISEAKLELLLKNCTDVNVVIRYLDGCTVLHTAFLTGATISILELLLKYGADPNIPFGLRNPGAILTEAIFRGRSTSLVHLLLKHGADPNARSPHLQQTPWELARARIDRDVGQAICHLLERYGAREAGTKRTT